MSYMSRFNLIDDNDNDFKLQSLPNDLEIVPCKFELRLRSSDSRLLILDNQLGIEELK